MIVTYVPDPLKADGKPVVGEVITTGTTVVEFAGVQPVEFAGVQPVFVTGGTIQSSISFSGSVQTDIGNVKIEDADENYAVIPKAGIVKTSETNALVVQHIDHDGNPLSQATQIDILNSQGTLATSALQAASSAILVSILNNQGTQAASALQATGNSTLSVINNNQGTLATSALQAAQNTLLVAIDDHQGTQSTSALQVAGNNLLVSILNAQGTQSSAGLSTAALQAIISNNQGTQATSALQAAGNAALSALLSAQGTQSTSGLATTALQSTGNSTLSVISNNQGTGATSALQSGGNAILSALLNSQGTLTPNSTSLTPIMNNQGTQATSALQLTSIQNGSTTNTLLRQLITLAGTTAATTLLNGVSTPTVSATFEAGFASQIAIQHIITGGTASINLRTSLNGVNWFTERTSTANEIFLLQGPTKYISADYTNGNATVTTLLLASAPGGGGGGVASSGTANQFGAFSVVLSQALNATYDISVDGYNGIGIHVVPPTGGRIEFEGSFDGVNFTAITLREVGANGYTQGCSYSEDYIGSIACMTKLRFRTGVAGTAPGGVGGRMTVPSNTLEGIEHGNAPHNIGYVVMTKPISSTGSIYNRPIWVPAAGKRPVITDIHFTVDATTTLSITDGFVALGSYLFNASFKPTTGAADYIPISFRTPHVTTQDGTVYYTQTASANVTGVMHGYEVNNPPTPAA